MKKVVLFTAALFALAMVAFAKPPKIGGWKDVAKLADKYDFEVVNDNVAYYVAKGNGGKDFAVYAVAYYDDATVTLCMSCIKGEYSSKTVFVNKNGDAPGESFTLGENDKKAAYDPGSNDLYIEELGLLRMTADVMEQRERIRSEICKDYGLVLPANVKKSGDNFKKAYEAAADSDFDDKASVQKLINIYFSN